MTVQQISAQWNRREHNTHGWELSATKKKARQKRALSALGAPLRVPHAPEPAPPDAPGPSVRRRDQWTGTKPMTRAPDQAPGPRPLTTLEQGHICDQLLPHQKRGERAIGTSLRVQKATRKTSCGEKRGQGSEWAAQSYTLKRGSAVYGLQAKSAQHLFVKIKFYWHMAAPIPLRTVCGSLPTSSGPCPGRSQFWHGKSHY